MQRKIVFLMLLILGAVLLRESRQGYAVGFEQRFSEWLASNANIAREIAPLVLVESISTAGGDKLSPLPPLDYALFLKSGMVFRPSLLAIEETLTWPKPARAPDPNLGILHDQILGCPKLVLGAKLGFPADPDLLPPLQKVPVLPHVKGDLSRLFDFAIVETQPLEDLRLLAPMGFTNLPLTQSPTRQVPLIFRYCGQVLPSFVLQTVMMWLQLTPEDIQVDVGSCIRMGDKLAIPIDQSGLMDVDFNSRFTRLGLDDLLLTVSQLEGNHTPVVAPESLNGKVLLLARTDLPSRTLLFPSGQKGAAGELFAAAIATIQNGKFAQRAPLVIDFLIISAVLLLSRCFGTWSVGGTLYVTLMIVPAYLLVAIAIYGATMIWIPIVLPFGLLALVATFRLIASAE